MGRVHCVAALEPTQNRNLVRRPPGGVPSSPRSQRRDTSLRPGGSCPVSARQRRCPSASALSELFAPFAIGSSLTFVAGAVSGGGTRRDRRRQVKRHPDCATLTAREARPVVLVRGRRVALLPQVHRLCPAEMLHDGFNAALQLVLFRVSERSLVAVCPDERFPDELARRPPVVVASSEQHGRLGKV